MATSLGLELLRKATDFNFCNCAGVDVGPSLAGATRLALQLSLSRAQRRQCHFHIALGAIDIDRAILHVEVQLHGSLCQSR